jgi:two-component system phosphate regulon response regulator PhoB
MKPTILVVDDDTNLTKLYEAALSARGYRVIIASDGETALTLAEKEKPNLIMLDIMMPVLHGLHVLDILKATPSTKDSKIIMLTALGDGATKEKALECGAFDYIVKSETNMAEVLERVSKALSV